MRTDHLGIRYGRGLLGGLLGKWRIFRGWRRWDRSIHFRFIDTVLRSVAEPDYALLGDVDIIHSLVFVV